MKAALAFLLLALLCSEGQAQRQDKRGYNLWAKEKIRYLNAKVTIEPYNPQLRVLLANAYFEDGQKYEAKRLLREALQLDSNYAEAHCNLAVMLHGQGYDREAKHHYEEALRLDSLMVEAMAGLGALLCRSERQAEGLEYLEEVVALQPDHVSARFNMAVAYHKVGDFKKVYRTPRDLVAGRFQISRCAPRTSPRLLQPRAVAPASPTTRVGTRRAGQGRRIRTRQRKHVLRQGPCPPRQRRFRRGRSGL